jgi:hypothetical protein
MLAEFAATNRRITAATPEVVEVIAAEVAEDVDADEVVAATLIAVIVVVIVVEMIVTGRLVVTMTSARTVAVIVDAALHRQLSWSVMTGLYSTSLCFAPHFTTLTHFHRGIPVVHASPPPTSKASNGAKKEASPSNDKKRSREDDGEGEKSSPKKVKADA